MALHDQPRGPREGPADPPPPPEWTILSLLEWASGYLARRGFDEARLNVELLLAHVLGLRRLDLYLQFDRPLAPEERKAFRALFERRLKHEPLQYILGETEFMGMPIVLDRSVLIPRPETEVLVERALEILKEWGQPADVLDIGTGSGNIAVALAALIPLASITSVDASADALNLARLNVERHHLTNVTLVQGDVFGDLLSERSFDMIVTNPPYVSADEYAGLEPEVREYEPASAVTDGASGFRVISRIAELAPSRLRPGGKLLMEIGYGQADHARELLAAAGLVDIILVQDFARIPRVIEGRQPGDRTEAPPSEAAPPEAIPPEGLP